MIFSITEINIIYLSLKIAFFATIITTILGLFLALYLEKSKSWISFFLDIFVSLPLFVPPIIIGYALLWIFSPISPVGLIIQKTFGASIMFTWIANKKYLELTPRVTLRYVVKCLRALSRFNDRSASRVLSKVQYR